MAKIPRIIQKLFAKDAASTEVGKFGSLAAGSPEYAADGTEIQELAAFEGGWPDAILGNNSPAIEDRNALDKLFSQQIGYLLEQGIPEWDAAQNYFIGSHAKDEATGLVYISLTDDNLNNPFSDAAEWRLLAAPKKRNLIRNSQFEISTRGWDLTGDTGTAYSADGWQTSPNTHDVHIFKDGINGADFGECYFKKKGTGNDEGFMYAKVENYYLQGFSLGDKLTLKVELKTEDLVDDKFAHLGLFTAIGIDDFSSLEAVALGEFDDVDPLITSYQEFTLTITLTQDAIDRGIFVEIGAKGDLAADTWNLKMRKPQLYEGEDLINEFNLMGITKEGEIAINKRYLQQLSHVVGFAQNSTKFTLYKVFPVEMRAAPTVNTQTSKTSTYSVALNVQAPGVYSSTAVPSLSANNTNSTTLLVDASGFSTNNATNSYSVSIPANNNNYILLVAEL